MKPLTVKDLFFECKTQIENGNGNKVIMISSDDEGNNFHYLWYSFVNAKELDDGFDTIFVNEDIAKKEDTMILG